MPSPHVERRAKNVFLTFAFRATKRPVITPQSGCSVPVSRARPTSPSHARHAALTVIPPPLFPLVLARTGGQTLPIEILVS